MSCFDGIKGQSTCVPSFWHDDAIWQVKKLLLASAFVCLMIHVRCLLYNTRRLCVSMRLFVFNLPRLCLSPRRSSLSSFPFPFPSPPSQRISQEEGERGENKALQATVCVCLIQRHRFVRSFVPLFAYFSPLCTRGESSTKTTTTTVAATTTTG